MAKKDVVYFAAHSSKELGFLFQSLCNRFTIRLAWWGKDKPNFFLAALCDLYPNEIEVNGKKVKEGVAVYEKALRWFLHIEEMHRDIFTKPAASLVTYKNSKVFSDDEEDDNIFRQ